MFSVFYTSVSHEPLCPLCALIWRQHPNPSVFNASPFILLTQIREPFFCSFQPRVPRIQNPAASDLVSFRHDTAFSASWAVEFSERTENGLMRLTQSISWTTSALGNESGSFTVGVAKRNQKKRKWNENETSWTLIKKVVNSYYQRNSCVLESE